METKVTLTDDTIDALQDLVRINLDSADGFRCAAENIENAAIASYFRQCATRRDKFATDLRQYVELNDEEAADHGSIKAQMHRWWIDMRGTVQDGAEHAILSEAERGEDAIKQCYENSLLDVPGNPLSDLLHEQYRQVKQTHDRIRDMRDERE